MVKIDCTEPNCPNPILINLIDHVLNLLFAWVLSHPLHQGAQHLCCHKTLTVSYAIECVHD